jgi:uncharacterized membrane protein
MVLVPNTWRGYKRSGTTMGSGDFTAIYIIIAAVALIVLIWLTMRSIIRRERAMIRENMDEPHEIAAYEERWRKRPGA